MAEQIREPIAHRADQQTLIPPLHIALLVEVAEVAVESVLEEENLEVVAVVVPVPEDQEAEGGINSPFFLKNFSLKPIVIRF